MRRLLAVAVALWCLAPFAARAEKGSPDYERVRNSDGTWTIRFKHGLVLRGRLPGEILLSRSRVGYDEREWEYPLTTRIHEATKHAPF
jgi:hypothetical protein